MLFRSSWLASSGTAAIVCFPGIFYRGGAEQKIRKYLVDNNFIDCIIQLPENLFYGTSIATCIMVLKKNKSDNSILFINASKEYVKVTNNNKLTDKNIDNILKYYEERKNIEYISSFIKYEKVVEENYNLSVNTYVELEDTREKIDVNVLNDEIEAIVKKQQVLRDNINKIINELGDI